MRKGVGAIALGLILLLAGLGFGGLDQAEQAKVDALAKTLQLNAEQKAKLIKEREDSKKKLLVLEKKWQTLHDALRREVRRRQPAQARIDQLSEDLGQVRGEIIALRTNSLLYLKSILTPEQVKMVDQEPPAEKPAESPK